MKKTINILIACLLSSSAMAQGIDYRKGNNNPFANYQYQTEAQWSSQNTTVSPTNNGQAYFSNSISSPIGSKNKKYQFLVDNSHELNGCWDKAASAYKLDPWLLMAIAQVESSFNKFATNRNSNKSIDLGMMQINTIWLPTLRKYGIEAQHLFQPCTSVFVGAWIIAQNIKHFGYNQDGIGAYNSPGNIVLRRAYAKKVYNSYNQLVRDFHPVIAKN